MFLAVCLVRAIASGTSWQGLDSTALITYEDRSFSAVYGSTLSIARSRGADVRTCGVCREGILDNCGVGLEGLRPLPRGQTEKCAILTGNLLPVEKKINSSFSIY